jgi:hypothetical protein
MYFESLWYGMGSGKGRARQIEVEYTSKVGGYGVEKRKMRARQFMAGARRRALSETNSRGKRSMFIAVSRKNCNH